MPKPNTDNKGHLYCHNFCKLLLLSIKLKIKHLHPDIPTIKSLFRHILYSQLFGREKPRICSPSKSCTRINFLAPIQLCTAILRQCLRASFVYRDKIRGSMLACTAISKIAPCFAHYGSGGILVIARIHSPPPFDSVPQTPFIAGPLGANGSNIPHKTNVSVVFQTEAK
jgi:hypothetical protein